MNESLKKFISDGIIIAKFELVRLFNTKRGLISLLAFAVVWYFVSKYPIALAAELITRADFKKEVSQMFGLLGFGGLFQWKVPELLVYWLAVIYIFPFLTLVLSADQTCSDRNRGTLRFMTLRTSRESIFFGRFLGQMIILLMLVLVTGSSTYFMAIYRDSQLASVAFQEFSMMIPALFILLLPFAAMMAMISATVKSARLATLFALIGLGVFSGLFRYLAYKFPFLDFLPDWLPGSHRIMLLKTYGWETLTTSTLPLIQTAIFLLAGRWIMDRNAL